MNPILTGNREEYIYLIKRLKIPKTVADRMYPYVFKPDNLFGLERHSTIFTYGSWQFRVDMEEITYLANYRQFNIINLGN